MARSAAKHIVACSEVGMADVILTFTPYQVQTKIMLWLKTYCREALFFLKVVDMRKDVI